MINLRELTESVAVALLTVRNKRGEIVVIPNPQRYAEMIAQDIHDNPPVRRSHKRRDPQPTVLKRPRITWIPPTTD